MFGIEDTETKIARTTLNGILIVPHKISHGLGLDGLAMADGYNGFLQ